jgi:hypothetical protein
MRKRFRGNKPISFDPEKEGQEPEDIPMLYAGRPAAAQRSNKIDESIAKADELEKKGDS